MRKFILTLFCAITAFFNIVLAADLPKQVTYQGDVAGVMCVACSDHVKTALLKLPGVEKVSVLPGDKPGLNKLIIVAHSSSITQASANDALGGQSRMYDVVDLALAKP